MSRPARRRVQRLALAVLAVLLVAVGASRIAEALDGGDDRCRTRPAVEVVAVSALSTRDASRARDVLYDETFSVRPGGSLDLDLGSESVTVRTVSGRRARVVVEGRGRDAEREFARRRFSARVDGDRLVVRTEPQRRRGFSLVRSDARFEVTVEIPRRFDAALDLGSGSVEVASLEGDLTVDVGSGSVSVADVDGRRVRLGTGSGSVRARDLRGTVQIETGSGSVRVERVEGPLDVDTGSGSVEVGLVDGPVRVDTGSGGVELALASEAPVEVDTGSGSVTLVLPRRAGFDVDIDASSVRMDDALRFDGRTERGEARGTIGGGGPTLSVDTGSGTVRLRAR